MLMHTDNAHAGGTDYIPFQHKNTSRVIDEKLGKRLEHHLQHLTR